MRSKPRKSNPDRYHRTILSAVNYQWTGSDGIICRGHSVAAGRSRDDAERRFFKQNSHVHQDTVDYAYD